jgi:hypothetical protein
VTGDAPVIVPSTQPGAGKSRKRRRKYQLEVDGEVYEVSSAQEAQEVLQDIRQKAEETAKIAVERAVNGKNRTVSKVVKDAKKALDPPKIEASPAISDAAKVIEGQIKEIYESALRSAEIAAYLNMQRRMEDEDDEDILLLI